MKPASVREDVTNVGGVRGCNDFTGSGNEGSQSWSKRGA